MNKKKTVIFHVNNKNQYYGEFHENAKLWMIKSFFKDISHINNFKFLYNGDWLIQDDITLRDLTKGSQSYEILILVYQHTEEKNGKSLDEELFLKNQRDKIKERREKSKEKLNNELNEHLFQENNSLKTKITSLEDSMKSSSSENENLQLVIIDLNNKLTSLQKCFENLSDSNINFSKQIEQLKKEKTDLEEMYKNLRSKFENYRSANIKRNNCIVQAGLTSTVQNKASSENQRKYVSSTTTKTRQKANSVIEINNPLTNISITEETPSPYPIQVSSKKTSKIKESSIVFTKKFSIECDETLQSSNIKKNNEILFNGTNIKVINDDPNIELIQDPPRQTNLSKSTETIPAIRSKYLNKKTLDSLTFEKNVSASDLNWKNIFTYLDKEDQYNLSLMNVEFFRTVVDFWQGITKNKIDNIHYVKDDNTKKYQALLAEENFQLSVSTNSALKVLNQPKFLEVFKKDYTYFEDNQLIPYYKLFCQFTKIFKFDFKDLSYKEFTTRIKEYFITNSASLGIGELCKSLAEKLDFSEENIERIFNMMQQYNIKTIDTVKVGKQCRTTGIILFMIKDALVYCGLDTNEKKTNKSQNYSEKKSLIEQNIDFNEMLVVSTRVLEKLKNTKSLIHI